MKRSIRLAIPIRWITLFVSTHFVLVIETKDIGGQIDFDDKVRQMIQTKADGTKMVYENPTDQVLRHRRRVVENRH
ncbi:nuclease-related domain-containing protein [Lysinibacillus sp. LZ02]|uniref:nuclease-related domain-containing protein n=1 Tax=Lysinibacillus sp. LZ02 TaxID=3420668 RepID=UPI003D35E8E4